MAKMPLAQHDNMDIPAGSTGGASRRNTQLS
jgi:hypothetical protein